MLCTVENVSTARMLMNFTRSAGKTTPEECEMGILAFQRRAKGVFGTGLCAVGSWIYHREVAPLI